jgi:chromate transporter
MVAALAALYVDAGSLPAMAGVLRAVKPVVVVVVLVAVVNLSRTAIRTWPMLALAAVAAAVAAAGANEVAVLLGAGLVSLAARTPRRGAAALAIVPLPDLFIYFVKTGSVIFGSGYVLFAIVEGDLVDRAGWITGAQLLDAIAVGQVTPGPVFTAATFIGYLVAGLPGAVVATVGVFLPAFVFAGLSARLLERLRRSRAARAFLDGVNAAAVALIAVVLAALARAAVVDGITAAIGACAAVLVWWLRVNSAWVILAAAALGLLL